MKKISMAFMALFISLQADSIFTCLPCEVIQGESKNILSEAQKLASGTFVFYNIGDDIYDATENKFKYIMNIEKNRYYKADDGMKILLGPISNVTNATLINSDNSLYVKLECVKNQIKPN